MPHFIPRKVRFSWRGGGASAVDNYYKKKFPILKYTYFRNFRMYSVSDPPSKHYVLLKQFRPHIISGFGSYPIQTEYMDPEERSDIDKVKEFTINSKNSEAWEEFLNSLFKKSNLNYYGYDTDYSFSDINDEVTFTFNNPADINFNIIVTKIGAQMAPGWIEN